MKQKNDVKKEKIAVKESPEEEKLYVSLRVDRWADFVGQEKVKQSIQTTIAAALGRREPLDHILLYGPPGLGKTTLSHIIAKERGVNLRVTSGPALERAGDLAAILSNLEPFDILFIDEIHRLSKVVEETLYPAMEDYCLDLVVGKGPSARTLRLDLPKFTIVGATTRIGLLSAPLRDRFGVVHHLTFYTPAELSLILERAAKKLKVPMDKESALELARRSRGTARVALKLLKRVRDFAQVKGGGQINKEMVEGALDMLEVDPLGLDEADRRYLRAVIDKHSGGPVGIETIAATMAEDIGTIEEVIEPYLMQVGFLKRTPRGRETTEKAHQHLSLFPSVGKGRSQPQLL